MRKIILMTSISVDGFIEGPTIFRDVIPENIRRLKQGPGGDMVLGGADVAAVFMSHDLFDEYWLYVHPVAIGQGKRLFRASLTRINLRLVESRRFGNGVVLLRYERKELLGNAEC